MTIEERFWSKVEIVGENDCWLWQAGKHRQGYGMFQFGGKMIPAHRVAYALAVAEPKESFVCHKCDNPPCCNPRHLFLGSHLDDMASKGRGNVGLPRQFLITFPDGRIEAITNLAAFCRTHGLNISEMRHVVYGIRAKQHHRGFRAERFPNSKYPIECAH